jgi:hypothetical protein
LPIVARKKRGDQLVAPLCLEVRYEVNLRVAAGGAVSKLEEGDQVRRISVRNADGTARCEVPNTLYDSNCRVGCAVR